MAGVEAAVEQVAAVRGWASSLESKLLIKAELLADKGKGAGARGTARKSGKRSSRNAKKSADRAGAVSANPSLGDDLGNGDVSEEHLDAFASAAKDVDEDQRDDFFNDPELTNAARRMPVEPFNKLARKKAAERAKDEGENKLAAQKRATRLRTWVNRADGMFIINGQFDPETGSELFRAIDAETATLAQRHNLPLNDNTRALALAALTKRGLSAGPNTTPPEIVVIDAATLINGRHTHTVSETSSGAQLPPETIRRTMCNCIINHITLDGLTGQALNVGRQHRVATRAQRRSLRAMYPTCAFDNCDTHYDHCQIHHIAPWEQQGPTDLDNLLPLCSHHHHLVHEGRWRVTLLADRALVITQPDGRHYKTIPLPSQSLAQHLTKQGGHGQGGQPNQSSRRNSGHGGDADAAGRRVGSAQGNGTRHRERAANRERLDSPDSAPPTEEPRRPNPIRRSRPTPTSRRAESASSSKPSKQSKPSKPPEPAAKPGTASQPAPKPTKPCQPAASSSQSSASQRHTEASFWPFEPSGEGTARRTDAQ